ncbi:MAG: ribosome biogenesis GTPase Der [Anaerolineae bacterium]|nr:ribosome biogenesis GTPase Der [Anaerolineae bacterium]MDW8102118.1 ribosome biogenesis GTPase Der [Anaerolineae bacterium]
MRKPIVAIVGRPNVGKSTLFNRLTGRKIAIVEDIPGTTRDRLYADAEWNGVPFTLVDTGGFEITREREPLAVASAHYVDLIRAQAQKAIEEADLILMVVDVLDGPTAADKDVADILRRSRKPVLLVVNKVDNEKRQEAVAEFYELGLGDPIPVSAIHGLGIGQLMDEVVKLLPRTEVEPEPEAVKIAIVGRPNVGKSSILNRLLGEERVIVSEIPGTTRDAIDTYFEWEGHPIILIDTAGIRRKGKIEPGLERYSVLRALRAISRSDVSLLILDGAEGVTSQDAHIAGYILEEAKSVIVIVNKWDLVPKRPGIKVEYEKAVRAALRFLDYVPILFVSAKTGEGINQIIPLALRVQEERLVRISTGKLNRIIQEAVRTHTPPSKAGKSLKIYYATQASTAPPTFVFFVNDPELVHFSYERYLENSIRKHYPFVGTPLKLIFRRRGE